MRLASVVVAAALACFGCGGPGPLVPIPNATLPPPAVKATPAPGPFNGSTTVTLTSDRDDAVIYYSTNGKDPRSSSTGRVSGPSPLTVTLDQTTTIRAFASSGGRDGDLFEGQWIRAGGPAGTITGVVVVGSYAASYEVGLSMNGQTDSLGKPGTPKEIPFSFDKLQSGTYRLMALADRNGDGNFIPFIDFQSDVTTITLDLTDPFKASAENVKIYLGASSSGLGTLKGTITLPRPPQFQNLQVSVLSPSALSGGAGGLDPQALLQQLQNGYRILTNQTDTTYPYVITNLQPGQYVPVPSLMGFGAGGLAVNFIANPLRPVTIKADQETVADFAFGPVTLVGGVTVKSTSPLLPSPPIAYGFMAAKSISILDGMQAVLMPLLFTPDGTTGDMKSSYAGQAIRANASVALRVFTNANNAQPVTDSIQWLLTPFGGQPPHATVQTTTQDLTQDVTVP
jgi:hypothetical protein